MAQDEKAAILVAEDSKFDQMILQRAFDVAGVNADLRFVSDGEDALTYLRESEAAKPSLTTPSPAIVLLDLHMPRMNGRETLAEIRRDPSLKHLPVIMLTTSSSPKHVREMHEIGANSYLVKPADFEQLVSVVKQLAQYWFEVAMIPSAGTVS